MSSISHSECPKQSTSPLKRASSGTSTVESFDSVGLIGPMSMDAIRPAPECEGREVGIEEPVSRNSPGLLLWSTEKRTASQSCGASCHLSIRRGAGP